MAAEKGNQYARIYTEAEALPLFIEALEYAETNSDCLCVQDAVINSKIPSRTFYDLCDQFKVLQDIKRDINDCIIARVNKGALKGTYNPTAGIWRMKQLGETDKTDIGLSGGLKINPVDGFKIIIEDARDTNAPETGASISDTYRNKT